MGEGRVLVTVDLRDAFQRVSRAAFFRVLLGRSDLGRQGAVRKQLQYR